MTKKKWTMEDLTDEKIDAQIAKAKDAWIQASLVEPRAKSVVYNQSEDKIVITLTNGDYFGLSPKLIEGLGEASPKELENVHLSGGGDSVHWEDLDVDYSIPGLVSGILGTKTWMAELGRKGGKKTSLTKAVAARENGKKGGRPRKSSASTP
ncbi:hypothetical protein NIES2119_13035 [[Phormidium ambiguum] IAM M-71]|uniref:DUF2442 domain-containing protein n=1 Tax=[Phormidium ambiguum] IAM M-71 TaxID=454136 RepID=A0A1U7IK60_9CYAN|nr:DUF2442 domain-containing protein [Phormidium ambiguum]OKH37623.1 hypothetical protein NIES2119_13035 [Phormidium ambiguum IAM M-71]